MAYPVMAEDLYSGGPGTRIRQDRIPPMLLADVGTILPLPYDVEDFPWGWFFLGGDQVPLASGRGQALYGLPAGLKSHYGIAVSGSLINFPDLFTPDGRGLFPRYGAVPGVRQDDAIRNIKGQSKLRPTSLKTGLDTGPFASTVSYPNQTTWGNSDSGSDWVIMDFDAGRQVPVADENRPACLAFLPAMFLGVDSDA
jgi:hypothetical protein